MGNLHTRRYYLQDDKTPFFVRTKAGALCFRQGTEMESQEDSVARRGWEGAEVVPAGQQKTGGVLPGLVREKQLVNCVCQPGWHGPYCGVPNMVYHSNLPTKEQLEPRETPRRVINAININHEFDLLHARFHELSQAVDLFVVCESNFTAYGEKRPLR